MKPRNSGLGLPGRDLNSGWNCGGAGGGAWRQVAFHRHCHARTLMPIAATSPVYVPRLCVSGLQSTCIVGLVLNKEMTCTATFQQLSVLSKS